MSIPIRCKTCHDIIGTRVASFAFAMSIGRPSHDRLTQQDCKCPGKGNHPRPVRKDVVRGIFWWKTKVCTVTYPETGTVSRWTEKLKNGKWEHVFTD